MTQEKQEKHKHEVTYYNEDGYATQKDLKILGLELKMEFEQKLLIFKLELEQKINMVVYKLGGLMVTCFGIGLSLISYFHK